MSLARIHAPRTALSAPTGARALLHVAWLLASLAAAVATRAAVPRDAPGPAMVAGAAFGGAAIAIAALAGWRPGRPGLRGLLVGLAGGVVLVVVPLALGGARVIGMRPEPLAAWVAVTVTVASGEEVLLRGALLSAVERLAGLPVAIGLTSAAFALMHVPLYGWGVVPLDLAVGVWLAGIRLTGGIGAAAAAHVIADLATWWL